MAERSTVQTHIPAFVERFAIQRLDARAKTCGLTDRTPVEVLFVCERNDGLSQMAASLFDAVADGRPTPDSAGTAPGSELLDDAVVALPRDRLGHH